jgi:hypothetical protein
MSLTMKKQEREAFLADVHVGIISISDAGRGPLTVPIWYAYETEGDVRIMTGRESHKGRLLAQAGRFSLCAQTENPPTSTSAWRVPSFLLKRPILNAICVRSRAVISARKWVTAMSRRRETYLRMRTTCLSACVPNGG